MTNFYANEVIYDLSNSFPNPVINSQLADLFSYSLRETSDGKINELFHLISLFIQKLYFTIRSILSLKLILV